MTRLTKAELAQHYAWLTSWHMPEETIFYVRQVNDYMGSVDFFAQAGVTFVRDAWAAGHFGQVRGAATRSEEHTSELQSLMRISYAVFCLKKKNNINYTP